MSSVLYRNTLHFCKFCNRSGTLQRLPSGSATDPIPYRDYPYPTEPIRASTIASFVIRSWVGAHAFFAARTKFYGHTQKRRKHCRSFSEFRCTYTSVTTYIPLPLWLFPGLRVRSSLVCCQFILLRVCVSILLL